MLLVSALLACLLMPAAHAVDFLDPEDAFKFSAAISDDGSAVEARFSIADGYYLYRERFGFAASDGRSTWRRAVPDRARSSSTKPSTGGSRSIAATSS